MAIVLRSVSWWRHQMETFSALLAICAGNSPFPGEFPAQRPVTRSFDVFFDLRLNKRLCKQSWGWWFDTSLRPLWRHCNDRFKSYAHLWECWTYWSPKSSFCFILWRNGVEKFPHYRHFVREFTSYQYVPSQRAINASACCNHEQATSGVADDLRPHDALVVSL